jgi:manganese/zinc/iron transport system permease protein
VNGAFISPLLSAAAAAQEPTFLDRLARLASFQDYNIWVPLLATAILGASAGVVGVFTVLRGRALIGDVVGHSALPGILVAFFVLESTAPGSGRSTPALMLGALASGILGAGCVLLIDRFSRIKADAALAIVLSIFYGGGAVLLSAAQRIGAGSQVGLRDYLSGKTASLVETDVWISSGVAVVLLGLTLLLFKEWALLCFDDQFASVIGRPVLLLDGLLIGLVAVVAIIGMKSVGLVLVVALLLIPASSARFWTDDVRWMAALAGAIGAASGAGGVAASALGPRLAAGPTIVLTGAAMFVFSLFLGRRRGVAWRWIEHWRLQRRIGRQDLMRACFEEAETRLGQTPDEAQLQTQRFTTAGLLERHRVGEKRLRLLIRSAVREELLAPSENNAWRLTPAGASAAARTARNHRLWELYLVRYADIAPSHVHHDADMIEHVLDPEIIEELERLVGGRMEMRAP